MDYSKLSDFEINSAVHNAMMKEPYKLEFLGNDKIRWIKKDSDVVTEKVAYGKTTLKDYCNNPADAWPIIMKNNITIINDKDYYPRATNDSYTFIHEQFDDCIHALDRNPLRAAMVVYLMMQEVKAP